MTSKNSNKKPNKASNKASTKNLVNTFQKQLNLSLSSLLKEQPYYPKFLEIKHKIKKCTSIKRFQKILRDYEELHVMIKRLAQNGILLSSILKGKAEFCNTALCLKYYNILLNLVHYPYFQELTWTSKVCLTSRFKVFGCQTNVGEMGDSSDVSGSNVVQKQPEEWVMSEISKQIKHNENDMVSTDMKLIEDEEENYRFEENSLDSLLDIDDSLFGMRE